jgi:hypothetical protein
MSKKIVRNVGKIDSRKNYEIWNFTAESGINNQFIGLFILPEEDVLIK